MFGVIIAVMLNMTASGTLCHCANYFACLSVCLYPSFSLFEGTSDRLYCDEKCTFWFYMYMFMVITVLILFTISDL